MQILFLVFMFVIGAIFGSFLCCQVRRLHEREVAQCSTRGNPERGSARSSAGRPWRRAGRTRPEREHEQLLSTRSICLHCKKQLKWYDNIPILSWLILRGKCRNCHKPIGFAEIISELSLAFTFLALGTYFLSSNNPIGADLLSDFPIIYPMDWAIFVATSVFVLSLAFLAIYDGLYGELPNFALTISAICAIILVTLQIGIYFLVAGFFDAGVLWQELAPPLSAAALFGGIYLVLYLISKGKWVGDGDWILAAIIGLALGHPWLSVVALLIANLAACIIMYPIVKKSKNHQIYFGPFLVLSFVVTYMLSDFIMSMI